MSLNRALNKKLSKEFSGATFISVSAESSNINILKLIN
jgi:hypothetical protein